MSFSMINILLLLAAAQGFFLTLVIIRQALHLYAARFLSVLIFFYSLLLTLLLLNDLQIGGSFLHVYIFFAGMPFLIGPLHYFYARHLLAPASRLQRRDILHFLPAVLVTLAFLPIQFIPIEELAKVINRPRYATLTPIELLFNLGIFCHALFYALLSLRLLKSHSKQLRKIFASADKTQVQWLERTTWLAIFIILIFVSETIFMAFSINISNFFQLSSFMVAFYVYTLGYTSIARADMTSDNAKTLSMPDKNTQKYQKSGLTNEQAQNLSTKLKQTMLTEKPFHDPGLTLNQLSELCEISPHNISQILNTQMGLHFFDFINGYRLDEVKKALHDPGKDHLTILAIAFDAGFNSKTAFNTIFKKTQGCTPSEFRKHR